MKKLLLLFAVMLSTVGAWAQTNSYTRIADFESDRTNSTVYALKAKRSPIYFSTEHNELAGYWTSQSQALKGDDADATNSEQQFAFLRTENTEEGKYYMYSVAGACFITTSGAGSESPEPIAWFKDVTDKDDANHQGMKLYLGETGDNVVNMTYWSNNTAGGIRYNTNSESDAGNVFEIIACDETLSLEEAIAAIEKVESNMVTVTYNYVYEGVQKYQDVIEVLFGSAYPDYNQTFPYGIVAEAKPEGNVEADEEVEITLSVDLPFVPATDNTSIEHWYYLSIKGNKLIDYEAGQEAIDLTMTSVPSTVDGRDACTWAFVGNPFDGFKLYNKKAGLTKILSSSTTIEGDGATTYPILIEETAVPAGNNTLWLVTASTHQTNGFFLAQKGSESNRMNDRDNKLAYWTGGADNGSTFTVSERDLTGITPLQALVDKVKEAQGNYVAGTTVGYLTQASIDGVAAAIAPAEEALKGTMTEELSIEHQIAINEAIAALETIQPEEGKFYNIVSSCTNDHRAGQQVYVNNSGAMHFAKTTDGMASSIGHVFQFVPGADGKFKIYNVERGVYMQSVGTASETDGNQARLVTITNMGKDNIVSIKPDGQNQMHAQDADSKIVGWNNNSYTNGSAWKIVEVADINAVSHPVTIGNVEWATLVLGYNAVIPEGVKAYAVSGVGAESASLVEVEEVIPANEAVLLNGPAETYEFKYSASASPVESNMLEGTVFDANIAANAYVLSAQGEPAVVGFYEAMLNLEENTKFKNNAFKAYLPVVSEARFLVFDFGGTETAIEGIEAENTADAVVYDLAGRRVQNAQKGVFVVNGKVVIK